MRIQINDTWYILPTSLREITLRQRIDFQVQYGNELDAMAKSILEMEEGPDKDLEMVQFHFERMFKSFSFFTGVRIEILKECEFIDEMAKIYHASLTVLFEDERKLEYQDEFIWEGEHWKLHPPELKQGDRLTFGELIDSKQMVQQMIKLGQGHWECLLPLCVIYLRKEDEVYQESFLYEDSDRLKLMEKLPLDLALQVGFFLSGSLSLYMTTLQSFNLQEQNQADHMSEGTLKIMDG